MVVNCGGYILSIKFGRGGKHSVVPLLETNISNEYSITAVNI